MAKVSVEVSLDRLLEESFCPAILGPDPGEEDRTAWVLYLPGEVPCICDSFDDAAKAMAKHLRKLTPATRR